MNYNRERFMNISSDIKDQFTVSNDDENITLGPHSSVSPTKQDETPPMSVTESKFKSDNEAQQININQQDNTVNFYMFGEDETNTNGDIVHNSPSMKYDSVANTDISHIKCEREDYHSPFQINKDIYNALNFEGDKESYFEINTTSRQSKDELLFGNTTDSVMKENMPVLSEKPLVAMKSLENQISKNVEAKFKSLAKMDDNGNKKQT